MIDKIIVMNLPAETRRRYLCEGALLAKGVPLDRFQIWECIDDKAYEKSQKLCEDASDDKIEQYTKLLDSGMYKHVPIAILAQQWNYFRIMRYIIEKRITAIVMHDDTILGLKFERLQAIISILKNRGNFHLLLLNCFRKPHVLHNELTPICAHSIIMHGICGSYDLGVIYSPRGANWVLNTHTFENDTVKLEDFYMLCSLGKIDQPKGCYTVFNDQYSHKEMGNRVYCPSTIFKPNTWDPIREPIDTT